MREWCLWEIFADSAHFKNHFFHVFQRSHYIFFSRHNGIRDLGKPPIRAPNKMPAMYFLTTQYNLQTIPSQVLHVSFRTVG